MFLLDRRVHRRGGESIAGPKSAPEGGVVRYPGDEIALRRPCRRSAERSRPPKLRHRLGWKVIRGSGAAASPPPRAATSTFRPAGLLNGETTKVGMTVVPVERAGMASGISGTMRFTGIVIGFAALGVVLFSRISAAITTALPALAEHDRLGFIREVASGDLSGASIASASGTVLHIVALRSFTEGYATLFAASAGFCCVAAVITWRLVRASDTPPIAKAKTQGRSRSTLEKVQK
jgi:hypothetical protein